MTSIDLRKLAFVPGVAETIAEMANQDGSLALGGMAQSMINARNTLYFGIVTVLGGMLSHSDQLKIVGCIITVFAAIGVSEITSLFQRSYPSAKSL